MAGGEKALRGVRVLELGSLVGGPFCGTLMAEFGAEVIKVEDPKVGTRHATLEESPTDRVFFSRS